MLLCLFKDFVRLCYLICSMILVTTDIKTKDPPSPL